MDLEQTISQIATLPVDDRLRLVQAVWESLPADLDCGVSPEQQAEIDRRVAAHDADPSSSISRDELARRLRGKS
jgi:putative addiction module component (TIGR02574 family)